MNSPHPIFSFCDAFLTSFNFEVPSLYSNSLLCQINFQHDYTDLEEDYNDAK
jgi:hypothetical protein